MTKNKIEIVFFDIDGTLRQEYEYVPESAALAIRQLQQKGIPVCICTGRTTGSIQTDVAALNFDGIVAAGGGYVAYKGKVLQDISIPAADMKAAQEYLAALTSGVAYAFEGVKAIFMNTECQDMLWDWTHKRCAELGYEGEVKAQAIRDHGIMGGPHVTEFVPEQDRIQKIWLWTENDSLYKGLQDRLTGAYQLAREYIWAPYTYREIICAGCNKGEGLTVLCREAGIEVKHALVFGDSLNDVDMFNVAGHSVAMANGAEPLKAIAETICEAPEEDGIQKELRRRGLI